MCVTSVPLDIQETSVKFGLIIFLPRFLFIYVISLFFFLTHTLLHPINTFLSPRRYRVLLGEPEILVFYALRVISSKHEILDSSRNAQDPHFLWIFYFYFYFHSLPLQIDIISLDPRWTIPLIIQNITYTPRNIRKFIILALLWILVRAIKYK